MTTGLIADGPAGLAHRRLSMIDLSRAARGPMANENQSIWLTYNGEMYNFREIRAWLPVVRGHVFSSYSDGEVIADGWEEWGEALLQRLG